MSDDVVDIRGQYIIPTVSVICYMCTGISSIIYTIRGQQQALYGWVVELPKPWILRPDFTICDVYM